MTERSLFPMPDMFTGPAGSARHPPRRVFSMLVDSGPESRCPAHREPGAACADRAGALAALAAGTEMPIITAGAIRAAAANATALDPLIFLISSHRDECCPLAGLWLRASNPSSPVRSRKWRLCLPPLGRTCCAGRLTAVHGGDAHVSAVPYAGFAVGDDRSWHSERVICADQAGRPRAAPRPSGLWVSVQ